MTFLYNECINIYTDASCKELDTDLGKIQSTCAGFMATYNGYALMIGFEVYIDEYAIFGEAKAIQMATQWVLSTQYRYMAPNSRPTAINIFSDNNAVVGKINSYIAKWLNLAANGKQIEPKYNGDGGMTSWDYIAFMAACNILGCNIPVRVFYTPGHLNIWNGGLKNGDSAKSKMVEINSHYHGDIAEEIDPYVIYEAATFNNVVDIMTRNFLYRNKYNIEASINAVQESLIIGPNKPYSLKWPFVIGPAAPTALQQPQMYMIGSRLMQRQAVS